MRRTAPDAFAVVSKGAAGEAVEAHANDPSSPAASNFAQRAVSGVLWTYVSFAGSKLLVFASTVILARLLAPAQFGEVGFALLVIAYLETIGDFGISSALIYERERPEQAANIAFVVSLATGVLWFAVAYACAPLVARFFDDAAVVPILRTISFVFIINALGNTHDALLRRKLEFKKRLAPDLAMAVLKGACSILLAVWGWGAWSLVWGQLIGATASTIALWIVVPWRPRWQFSREAMRRMLGYGGQVVSVNVIAAIVHDIDYVIVGRLGSVALGFYTLAYRTPELFITMIIWVVGKVAFPIYSRLQDDRPALRQAFLVTLRYLSLLTVPAGVGLAVLGGLFVSTFYGEQWQPTIATLQALSIAGCLRSLGSHAGDVYKATGRPDILVKLGVLRAAVLIPALIWGARYGIFGVAVAQIIVTGASTLVNLYVAGKIMEVSMRALLGEFKTAILSAAAMVVGLQLLLPVLKGSPKWIGLSAAVVAGGAIYVGVAWLVGRETIEQARAIVGSSLKKTQ
ncbi:MAG TPA: lipopolysaccharide biosynthesis protein [Pyrinomonadaceae bacterium]|jgi:PST family polysaccharide transporter